MAGARVITTDMTQVVQTVAAPAQPRHGSGEHPTHHGVEDCLALLAAAVGLAALARLWTTRSPAAVWLPGTGQRRWITVRGPGTCPADRELAMLGVCRT
jgi:hypothetical protein